MSKDEASSDRHYHFVRCRMSGGTLGPAAAGVRQSIGVNFHLPAFAEVYRQVAEKVTGPGEEATWEFRWEPHPPVGVFFSWCGDDAFAYFKVDGETRRFDAYLCGDDARGRRESLDVLAETLSECGIRADTANLEPLDSIDGPVAVACELSERTSDAATELVAGRIAAVVFTRYYLRRERGIG